MTDNTIQTIMALPLAPSVDARQLHRHMEMEIYVQFMRHLRLAPHADMTVKILCAIQFTADTLNLGDDYVAKVLVDCGLQAPRKAFPHSYLRFVSTQNAPKLINFETQSTLKLLSKLGNVSDFVADRA